MTDGITEKAFSYPELHLSGEFSVQLWDSGKKKWSPKTPSDHSLGRGYVDFFWLDSFTFRDDDFQDPMI